MTRLHRLLRHCVCLPLHDTGSERYECRAQLCRMFCRNPELIVEFEEGRAARAECGFRLLPILADSLEQEFGRVSTQRTFDTCGFLLGFSIRDALRPELSWTHYWPLLKVESEAARSWYGRRGSAELDDKSARVVDQYALL
jgi:hypothetical protein